MSNETIAPYAPVVLKLLQNVLYHDDTAYWDALLNYQTPIKEHFARIGLNVHINESDGFAFLEQPQREDDDGKQIALPRLTRRDRLSYPVTLLCVLLRERLDQFDTGNPDSDKLIVAQDELRDMLRPFVRERNDERTLFRKLDGWIERVADLGFLRRITGGDTERYEVRRVLKARVDSDTLAAIKEKLVNHVPSDA